MKTVLTSLDPWNTVSIVPGLTGRKDSSQDVTKALSLS